MGIQIRDEEKLTEVEIGYHFYMDSNGAYYERDDLIIITRKRPDTTLPHEIGHALLGIDKDDGIFNSRYYGGPARNRFGDSIRKPNAITGTSEGKIYVSQLELQFSRAAENAYYFFVKNYRGTPLLEEIERVRREIYESEENKMSSPIEKDRDFIRVAGIKYESEKGKRSSPIEKDIDVKEYDSERDVLRKIVRRALGESFASYFANWMLYRDRRSQVEVNSLFEQMTYKGRGLKS